MRIRKVNKTKASLMQKQEEEKLLKAAELDRLDRERIEKLNKEKADVLAKGEAQRQVEGAEGRQGFENDASKATEPVYDKRDESGAHCCDDENDDSLGEDESKQTSNWEVEWASDGLSRVFGEGAGQLIEVMHKGEGQVGQDVALDSSFSPGVQSTPKNRRNRGRRERGGRDRYGRFR